MVDKLVLITRNIKPSIEELIRNKNKPGGYYANSLDLSKTHLKLPVRIYLDGRYNHKSKIQIDGIAKLGLKGTKNILKRICDTGLWGLKINRIDLAVDLEDFDACELAECCRVRGAQKSVIYHSRTGDSFYIQYSFIRKILIYDKRAGIARLEVQLRARGVPITNFMNIRRYADIDNLENLFVESVPRIRKNLKPEHRLAALGMLGLVRKFGLQTARKVFKKYSHSQWGYWYKKLFLPKNELPDLKALMHESICDWLEDRIHRSGPASKLPRSHSIDSLCGVK
jgi:hypothetical protein